LFSAAGRGVGAREARAKLTPIEFKILLNIYNLAFVSFSYY